MEFAFLIIDHRATFFFFTASLACLFAWVPYSSGGHRLFALSNPDLEGGSRRGDVVVVSWDFPSACWTETRKPVQIPCLMKTPPLTPPPSHSPTPTLPHQPPAISKSTHFPSTPLVVVTVCPFCNPSAACSLLMSFSSSFSSLPELTWNEFKVLMYKIVSVSLQELRCITVGKRFHSERRNLLRVFRTEILSSLA